MNHETLICEKCGSEAVCNRCAQPFTECDCPVSMGPDDKGAGRDYICPVCDEELFRITQYQVEELEYLEMELASLPDTPPDPLPHRESFYDWMIEQEREYRQHDIEDGYNPSEPWND
jgi:hypothetical protein